jgi:hypothetical protein
MRITKFDLTTYNQTRGTGTPLYSIVDEEFPDLGIVVDEKGSPTHGGKIGYALAYILLAGFVGILFYYL